MSAIIKIIGLADGTMFTKDLWVESYYPDAEPDPMGMSELNADGTGVINGAHGGKIIITPYRVRAQRFATNAMAMVAWNAQSMTHPYRRDGRPNKPMTALTVEIEPEWPKGTGWDVTKDKPI